MASSSGGDVSMSEAGAPPGIAQFSMRNNVPPFGGGGPSMALGMGAQASAGGNVSIGGVPGVSLEMMQSFVHRKMDGSGQPPGGMN